VEEEEEEGKEDQAQQQPSSKAFSWWRPPPPQQQLGAVATTTKAERRPPALRGVVVEVRNAERAGSGRALPVPVCRLRLPPVRAGRLAGTLAQKQQEQQPKPPPPPSWWAAAAEGPLIRLALPSFSGATPDVPGLLKYACALKTNVLPAPIARVEFPGRAAEDGSGSASGNGNGSSGRELMDLVLGGKPLVAFCFNDMVMHVDEPEPLPLDQQQQQSSSSGGRRGLLGFGRRKRDAEVAVLA
jgi:hypothetical protein